MTDVDGTAVIELEAVTKKYNDVLAVDDLSLRIGHGEFITLLGPSGCGKTTTLRAIGGFEFPDRGRVRLLGHDVTSLPPFRRPVNTVFQRYALFPHLTVRQNVAYGLRTLKLSSSERSKRVDNMIDLVQLGGMGERKPRELSGGQQQRVALARALALEPEVLLLDEPLGALDYQMRKRMQIELKEIHHRLGTTFVYVTHDQEEALAMSDRICVMRKGRVVQDAPPEAIYRSPATRYVAEFVGNINFLAGKVFSGGIEAAGLGTIECTSHPFPMGSDVVVGIRYEDVALDEGSSLRGRCVEALPLGALTRVSVEVGNERIIADIPGSHSAPRRGDHVGIGLPDEGVKVFRAEEDS